VLFLAPRRELIHQAVKAFQGQGLDAGMIMAGERQTLLLDLQVASFDTLHARAIRSDRMKLPPADLVIVDEAHLSTARTRLDILEAYGDAIVIGLTATPARGDGKGLGTFYDDIVTGPTISELVDMGYLVPLRYYAPTEPDLSKLKLDKDGDYQEKALGARMDTPQLIGDIVDNWLRLARERRTVVFCVTCDHSRHTAEAFREAGITAEHLDGETPKPERAAILARVSSGETQVLCNVFVASYGLDIPALDCAVLARPTKNIALYLQTVGRIMRTFPGKDCLARGTQVLTDKGLVEIQNVTLDHAVWDGVSFVSHGGAFCKGIRKTIQYQGLTATPDHEVMTDYGWISFAEAASHGLRIVEAGSGGFPVRVAEGHIPEGRGSIVGRESGSLLHEVRRDIHAPLPQHAPPASHESMHCVREAGANDCPEMAVSALPSPEGSLHKQEVQGFPGLWRQGDRVSIPLGQRSVPMDCGELGCSGSIVPTGSDRQRRPLRTRESSVGESSSEHGEHAQTWRSGHVYGFPEAAPGGNVFGQHLSGVDPGRAVPSGDNCSLGSAFEQAEREVWDIHDCGPLQRFTANNLLVHNCGLVIDHAGAVKENGFADDYVPWSLDDTKSVKDERERMLKEKAQPKPATCPQCATAFKGQRVCPSCGFEVVPAGKPIPVHEADLQEIQREAKKENRDASWDEKAMFHAELTAYAISKGKQPGWIAHKYRARYSVWPNDPRAKSMGRREPSPETLSWIQSQNIRWAKSKKA
jgi:uncharacterized Zn finger protein (UPF0148 family)